MLQAHFHEMLTILLLTLDVPASNKKGGITVEVSPCTMQIKTPMVQEVVEEPQSGALSEQDDVVMRMCLRG